MKNLSHKFPEPVPAKQLKQSAAQLAKFFFVIAMLFMLLAPYKSFAQAPTISYSSPQTYAVGTAISPLTPTASGVAAQDYYNKPLSIAFGFDVPQAIAVDAAGNVYVTDFSNNALKKIPPGGGTPVIIGSGFKGLKGVAIDAAGNIYVIEYGTGSLKKIPGGGGTPITIGSGFNRPNAIAVDAVGNIYVSNADNTIEEIPAGSSMPVTIASGFNTVNGIAIDAAGNLYIAEYGTGFIKEIPADGGAIVTIGSGFRFLEGVAVDAAGNVYVVDNGNGAIKKIPAGGGTPLTIASGFNEPWGVAVDAAGIVYFTVANRDEVEKIIPAGGYYTGPFLPAGLIINSNTGIISGTPTVVSPATNYIVTAYNAGGSATATVNIKIATSPHDATLSNLTASSGAFDQAFVSATDRYTQTVPFTTSAITVTPFTNNPNATVRINGSGVASGTASGAISLNIGPNTITNTITAQDGITTKTYTITVTRRTQAPTIRYSSPQTYTSGTAISPLTPTASGVAAQGYYSAPLTIGSGFHYPAGVAVDGLGNVYVADEGNSSITEIPANGGTPVTIGSGFIPRGVAVDAAGNVYVADASNTVKKVPAGGGMPVTIGAGFAGLSRVAVDAVGNVYVTDNSNGVKKIPAGGGTPVIIAPGLNQLYAVAVDAAGNVYVTDTSNTVKKIPAGGGTTLTIASGVSHPNGVAVDAAGNVYVTDYAKWAVKEIPGGGGTPVAIGSGFFQPGSIAVDAAGILYIVDEGNKVIKKIIPSGGYYTGPFLPAGLTINSNTGVISGTPTVASPATNYTVTAYNAGGSGTATVNIKIADSPTDANLSNLTASSGAFDQPFVSTTDHYTQTVPSATSEITVTPTAYNPNATVKVNGTGVTSGTASGAVSLNVGLNTVTITVTAADGVTTKTYTITVTRKVPAPTFSYSSPQTYRAGTAISPLTPTASWVAAQAYNNTPVTIGSGFDALTSVAVDATGNVYVTDWIKGAVKEIPAGGGTPIAIGSGFNEPVAVAADAAGNVYVADFHDIKKTPAGGGTTVTIASGFSEPEGLAVDAVGNVYVADYGNGTIVKIPAGGGTPVTIGSGFIGSGAVAVDAAGNVYLVDYGNHAVKEIPAGGGAPVTIASGFSYPTDVAVDAAGNVYVTDNINSTVKEIPAGGGAPVTIGSGFMNPYGIAVDATGKVYVADYGNHAAKEIIPVGGYYTGPFLPAGLIINSNTGVISGTPTAASAATNYTVTAYNATGSGTATVNIKVTPSTDATLSNLAVSSGTLTPSFSSSTINYMASVSNAISSITVTPTTNNGTATVKVNGTAVASGSASGSLPLSVGANTITTIVTAQDETTTKTYTVTVTRAPSTDATLSNLVINSGTLTPSFVGGTTSYTTSVSNATTSITVTPTTNDATASVKVNGTTVASGTASGSLPLSVGANTITTIVTAQDETTTKTYTVKVTRDKASQTITFNSLPAVNYSSADFVPGATVSSGLPISYSSSKTSVATIVNGKIHITGAGNSTITASQSGDQNYHAAPSVSQHLLVDKAHQTIFITTIPPLLTGSKYDLSAFSASSGLPVSFTTADPVIASVNGQTLNAVHIGTTSLIASQPGDNNFYAAENTREIINVVDARGDEIVVHKEVSPNGDGINDFLFIEGIKNYQDNRVTIIDRNGFKVFETTGYDDVSRVFNGHSNFTGTLQQAGTYFYLVAYTVNGELKHKTGYFVLKYQ